MKENQIKVPRDFSVAVKDIKLAILQSRARAARMANVEVLKLYFYVGGYVSKKTRTAKWGTGAINALSARLQVELPGLRGSLLLVSNECAYSSRLGLRAVRFAYC